MEVDLYAALVEKVSEKSFNGNLPEPGYESVFISSCLAVFIPEETPVEVMEAFERGLLQAIEALRLARGSKWKN